MAWMPPDDSPSSDPSDLQQRRSGAEVVAAVLRVHLTAEDLMRVRLSPGPAPMIELSLGVAGIRRREPSPAVLAWHAGLDRRLPRPSRALFDLIRPTGAGPLFLDPPCPSFAEGMDRVQSMSTEALAADLRLAHRPQDRLAPRVRDLASRDPDATRLLVAALDGAHRVLVSDQWARIQAGVNADLAWRRRLLADYGVRALLDSLYPSAWWQDLVLHLPSGGNLGVRLDGTGLTLQPVANWTGGPLAGYDAYGSLLLVYRAARPVPLLAGTGSDGSPPARRPAWACDCWRASPDPSTRLASGRPARPGRAGRWSLGFPARRPQPHGPVVRAPRSQPGQVPS